MCSNKNNCRNRNKCQCHNKHRRCDGGSKPDPVPTPKPEPVTPIPDPNIPEITHRIHHSRYPCSTNGSITWTKYFEKWYDVFSWCSNVNNRSSARCT